MKISEIIFIIIWLSVGFIGMIFMHLQEMRGKEFGKNYFNKECIIVSIFAMIFGCALPVILFICWCKDKKPFTRLLHKIANIGVNKKR